MSPQIAGELWYLRVSFLVLLHGRLEVRRSVAEVHGEIVEGPAPTATGIGHQNAYRAEDAPSNVRPIRGALARVAVDKKS